MVRYVRASHRPTLPLLVRRSISAIQFCLRGAATLDRLQRAYHCFRLTLDDLEQRPSSARRRSLALLPLSQRRGADSNCAGELVLRETQALARLLDFIGTHRHLVYARTGTLTLSVGQ